jgi:hypothetical protein
LSSTPREPLISTLERAPAGISGHIVNSTDNFIEKVKRDALNALNGQRRDFQRLADILGRRLGILPTLPSSDSSECGDEENSGKDTRQALKLKNKLIDETYVGSNLGNKIL